VTPHDQSTHWVRSFLLVLFAGVSIIPLVYMVLVSLKENAYLIPNPLKVLQGGLSLDNYATVWLDSEFPHYFLNSLVVAVATTAATVWLASMTAYGLARFDFPGKRLIEGLILLELAVPAIVLLIPQFLLAKDLHLLDKRLGLVFFYVGVNFAFITFLMIGFFRGVPRALDDAMMVDGASAWRRYWQLMVPLTWPAHATAAIFAFLGSWDEYVWALTIINDPSKRTLPVGVALFSGQHQVDWGLTFAASVVALAPVIAVFIAFQRQFVRGVMTGALRQ